MATTMRVSRCNLGRPVSPPSALAATQGGTALLACLSTLTAEGLFISQRAKLHSFDVRTSDHTSYRRFCCSDRSLNWQYIVRARRTLHGGRRPKSLRRRGTRRRARAPQPARPSPPRRDRAMARLPGEDSELRVGRRTRRRNLRNSELVTVLGQLRPVPALRHAVSGYRRSWNG